MPKLYIQFDSCKVMVKELPDEGFAHLPVIRMPISEDIEIAATIEAISQPTIRKAIEFVRQKNGMYVAEGAI